MGGSRPNLPSAPQPTRVYFDPFNSSSTGHQRAENRLSGSTSWRDSRSYKLGHQFRDSSGRGGEQHLSDLVGAGSENFGKDGRKENGDWEPGAPGLRERGWQDIRGLLGDSRKRRNKSIEDDIGQEDGPVPQPKRPRTPKPHGNCEKPCRNLEDSTIDDHHHADDDDDDGVRNDAPRPTAAKRISRGKSEESSLVQTPQIFRNLNMYLNGSTAPLVSDHKLKQIFSRHGGNTSIALGRRTVTHVIIGADCGGGLAAGKIQKEATLVGGKGIKYVTAQWVLDSVEKGIRQPEARYAPKNLEGKIGGSGQGSVRNMFLKRGAK
ncbi:hypothetical protein PV08_11126 [Exophiala spinifera]|uniref:BRCT domain-containing protein n=1 Tax=Exophiala spinifera TaxID=91928 RepID=A0A0D2AUI6_9EURO|nr:uncharacterized protein PV08_11126 [Exophiala spinifera]KIW10165.1 hypothetical protein PV08_11126 [Exophiala spinifera]